MIKDALTSYVSMGTLQSCPFVLHRAILMKGVEKQGSPLPKGIRRGRLGMCFKNAAHLAIREGYTYYEGFAVSEKVFMPIHHAWVEDEHGKVIDNTWKDPQTSYYMGVPVHDNLLSRILLENKVYGVLSDGGMYNLSALAAVIPESVPMLRELGVSEIVLGRYAGVKSRHTHLAPTP